MATTSIQSSLPNNWEDEIQQIDQRRRYAEALRNQGQVPIETQMISGRVVPYGWANSLANLIKTYTGTKQLKEADQSMKELSARRQQALTDTLGEYRQGLQSTNAQEGRSQALAALMRNPDTAGYALQSELSNLGKTNNPVVLGKSLVDPVSGQVIATDATWKEEQEASRKQREQELNMRLADNKLAREERMALQRELANQSNSTRREIASLVNSRDAREKAPSGYRFTKDGNLEMIPGGPADQKTQQRTEGGQTVDTIASGLRDLYNQLDNANAITNPNKGTLSNLVSGISSSTIGQSVGKSLGTKNQSLRNSIAQQRPLLLQSIMKATGMSAKQIDSNKELQLYLSAATDPTLDIEANKRALDMIEKLYGSSSNKNETSNPKQSTGFKVIGVR